MVTTNRSTTTTHKPTRAPKGAVPAPTAHLLEACQSLFGEHPEDVIAPINSASETLYWLEEIFKTISREALDASAGYRIKHLAEAGAYLAFDIANFTDCHHEDMLGRLRSAGVAAAAEGATA